jgi:hypothetical protein
LLEEVCRKNSQKIQNVCLQPVEVPLVVNEKLMKDDKGKKVDVTFYRSLVGNLLYLTQGLM